MVADPRCGWSPPCVPEPVYRLPALVVVVVTDYKEPTNSWPARGGAAEKHPSTLIRASYETIGHSTHSTPREACRREACVPGRWTPRPPSRHVVHAGSR